MINYQYVELDMKLIELFKDNGTNPYRNPDQYYMCPMVKHGIKYFQSLD